MLIGDAAHSTHDSIGDGTCLAVEDALALVDNLAAAQGVTPALRTASLLTRGGRLFDERTPPRAADRLRPSHLATGGRARTITYQKGTP